MKYIPLDAVVAEIERKKKYAQTLGDNAINGSMQQFYDGMKQGCVDILSSINTLEVKDVDLEKEILNYIGDEASCKYGKWTWYECNKMIRYFFELGIKAQKGEEV